MEMNSGNRTDSADGVSVAQVAIDVRHMTQEQLASLGVTHIAYIKPIVMDGGPGYAIHAADGTPMALTGDREVAVAAIVQHEMHPLSVH